MSGKGSTRVGKFHCIYYFGVLEVSKGESGKREMALAVSMITVSAKVFVKSKFERI